MLHRVKEKKLGRDAGHRKALIKNLSTSLVLNKKVETTLAKAKYVKPFVEKLITKARKSQDFNSVKYAKDKLTTVNAVNVLFKEVVPLFENRQGGYTRIVKLPERDGDKAKMARIEFVIEKPAKTKGETTDKAEKTEKKTDKKAETRKAKKTKEVKKVKKTKEAKESEEAKEDPKEVNEEKTE